MTSLPAGWIDVALGDVCDVRLGRQRSPKHHSGTQMRPYVRAANVGWDGLRLEDVKSMNFTDEEMAVYELRCGDLLLNEASGSAREVGKPAIWNNEVDRCAFQNTLLRVRSKGPEPRYLLHLFRHSAKSGRFASLSRGVGIFHLGKKALAEMAIPLPPLEEQRRIAAILDKADELRVKRRSTLGQFDMLTQAIFLDMFGDPVTNSRCWPEGRSLGEVADVVSGITKGRRTTASTRQVPYMAVANVQDKRLSLSAVKNIDATEAEIKRYRLEAGDVLLTEGGDPDKLGRGTVWREELPEAIHQNHIFRVRPDRTTVAPDFLAWLVGSERGKRYFLRSAKQTTGIASINATQLRAFPLVLPPLESQLQFDQTAAQVRNARERADHADSEVGRLILSLQSRAFRGEL